MVELAELVLRLLGLALPGEHSSANFFDEFMFQPSGNLRLLHYPPQTSTDELQLGGATSFSPEFCHTTNLITYIDSRRTH